ncbi:MAG TPA: DNA-processing protein DprA [Candidatus Polarisedimenticolia bacterium]|nr:DNA-processing protein DprA [Candidatus Polarisedimenticolia bacterium]
MASSSRDDFDRARRLGVVVLTPDDPGYPPLLKGTADPPGVLYMRGGIAADDRLAIAVVGARRATPSGLELARRIGVDLARAGFTVVSGLARGIDAAAHRGALEGGGRTIAVLGSGLDRIYPEEHEALARSIVERGTLLSEQPPGVAPLGGHFPKRNRIIAGMAWATVVVEGTHNSGSLITANLALEEGRLVFAVPGNVGEPNAEGTNALLRSGAHCCRGAEDVLEDLGPMIVETAAQVAAARGAAPGVPGTAPGVTASADTSPDERAVIAALARTRGKDLEAIGQVTGLAPQALNVALLGLELRGIVVAHPGPRYFLKAAPERSG